MTTGERIKKCRKELNLSAEKLAEKLGISPATIYRWEKGDIEKVPGPILEPLADALQTTPDYLMGWDTHKEPARSSAVVDGDVATMLEQFALLSPEQKRQILDYTAYLLSSHGQEDAPHK